MNSFVFIFYICRTQAQLPCYAVYPSVRLSPIPNDTFYCDDSRQSPLDEAVVLVQYAPIIITFIAAS
mgnify:CR=1 FL=1